MLTFESYIMIDHPLGWTLEQRLEHCLNLVEKTIDRYPAIADIWYKEAKKLENQISVRDRYNQSHTEIVGIQQQKND